MSDKKLYYASRPFDYMGKTLDRLQVVTLANAPNDEALLRLKYFREVEEGMTQVECGTCQARFVSDSGLAGHGKLRHSGLQNEPGKGAGDLAVGETTQRRVYASNGNDAFAEELENQHRIASLTTPLALDQAKAKKDLPPEIISHPTDEDEGPLVNASPLADAIRKNTAPKKTGKGRGKAHSVAA